VPPHRPPELGGRREGEEEKEKKKVRKNQNFFYVRIECEFEC
jgi:hypothetical protein